jgi:DNA repair protein RadC
MAAALTPAQKAWATRRAKAAKASAIATAPVKGFCEPSASIETLADSDLLALFCSVGALVSQRFLHDQQCLSSWSLVLDYLKSVMAFRRTEQFRVLFLDKRNVLIADEAMGEGTVDHVPVYPREVARRALELNASALILAHNHPTGDTTPSAADVEMTHKLVDALKPFGITVHDHIIVARGGHASLKQRNLF